MLLVERGLGEAGDGRRELGPDGGVGLGREGGEQRLADEREVLGREGVDERRALGAERRRRRLERERAQKDEREAADGRVGRGRAELGEGGEDASGRLVDGLVESLLGPAIPRRTQVRREGGEGRGAGQPPGRTNAELGGQDKGERERQAEPEGTRTGTGGRCRPRSVRQGSAGAQRGRTWLGVCVSLVEGVGSSTTDVQQQQLQKSSGPTGATAQLKMARPPSSPVPRPQRMAPRTPAG